MNSTPRLISLFLAIIQIGCVQVTAKKSENDCFKAAKVIPGKTSKSEVLTQLGEPFQILAFGAGEQWIYHTEGQIDDFLYFEEDDNKVIGGNLSFSKCTLGDLVSGMGPPEFVELELVCSDIVVNGKSTYCFDITNFHYPSQGILFTDSKSRRSQAVPVFSRADRIKSMFLYRTRRGQSELGPGGGSVTKIEWPGFSD